jgi:hypothetical protein
MVWPITGAESYVCEKGKSMNAVDRAQEDCWREIAIALNDQRSKRVIDFNNQHGLR